ncbi:MAG: hypothetical protein E7300_03095 [Lachnospiraceae bacterium]|nr:hypothetical protein [Lachnospiraceae bacterium]
MMKMLIKMDEAKIREERKYDISKINAYLAKAFAKRHMELDDDGWYINGNFSTCGSLIITLSQKDWFIDNLMEWLWYDEEDASTEDLKARYSKEKTIA